MTEKQTFQLLAVLVMLIFYSIYFIKMFSQKKKGIKTNQLGKKKEKDLHLVETLMGIGTFSIVGIQLLSIILNVTLLPTHGRIIGFIIAMMGNVVFLISVLCMKDSWRAGIPEKDKTKLVTRGIYKISRNPAFLGFDIMYMGILLMFFNFGLLIITIYVMVMLHLQILQEEKYLTKTFGNEYLKYKSQVLRYIGRKS